MSALPVIIELKPGVGHLPPLVRVPSLDQRRRQLPTAALELAARGVNRARYERADGRVTEAWFSGTGWTLLDTIPAAALDAAQRLYGIGDYAPTQEPLPFDLAAERAPSYVAGQRVQITAGPNAGKLGALKRGEPDGAGLYHIQLDDGAADEWGGFWYHVAGEFRIVSVDSGRPWANDAAYAAEGAAIG